MPLMSSNVGYKPGRAALGPNFGAEQGMELLPRVMGLPAAGLLCFLSCESSPWTQPQVINTTLKSGWILPWSPSSNPDALGVNDFREMRLWDVDLQEQPLQGCWRRAEMREMGTARAGSAGVWRLQQDARRGTRNADKM